MEIWAWLNCWREPVYTGTREECMRWYDTQSNIAQACDLVRL